MLRFAEHAVVRVDIHKPHDEVGELALLLDGEAALQRRVVDAVGVLLDLVDERHELFAQSGEEGVAGRAVESAFVVVKRGVVGVLAGLLTAAHELRHIEHLLQIRLEGGEVVLLLGVVPDRVRLGGKLGVFYEDVFRYAAHTLEVADVFGNLAARYGVERIEIRGERADDLDRFG